MTSVDRIPPVVTCPRDITETVEIGTQGASVFFPEATATDNSGTFTLSSRSHAPGSFFTLGTTEVRYAFTDPSGNTGECTFNVIVVSGMVICPIVYKAPEQSAWLRGTCSSK